MFITSIPDAVFVSQPGNCGGYEPCYLFLQGALAHAGDRVIVFVTDQTWAVQS